MSLIIATCYYENIPVEVRDAHKRIAYRFMPEGAEYVQILTNHHGLCMTSFTRGIAHGETNSLIVWLDIDAIPLCKEAFIEPWRHGNFWGCAQRANHIQNGGHIYAGPFAMGITCKAYRDIGMPPFVETARGDVGEELTYQYEALAHRPPFLMWPTKVRLPRWSLTENRMFGLDTVYGTKERPAMFYHAFEARNDGAERFLAKCAEVESQNLNP